MATLIDEKGLQHYADKMVKAENRKVGTKSLPTALTEIDAMIDSMKGKFEQAYGDALEESFDNQENTFKVGTGVREDRSETVEDGFISIDKLEGRTLVNRLKGENKTVQLPHRIELDEMIIKPNTDYTFQSTNGNAVASFKQPKYQEIVCQDGVKLEKNLDVSNKIEFRSVEGETLKNCISKDKWYFVTAAINNDRITRRVEANQHLEISVNRDLESWNYVNCGYIKNMDIKENTTYTLIGEIITGVSSVNIMDGDGRNVSTQPVKIVDNKAVIEVKNIVNPQANILYITPLKTQGVIKLRNLMLLEGDYSKKEVPQFFEGIQGVGEQFNIGLNIVDPERIKENVNVQYNSGKEVSEQGTNATDYIRIKPNTQYSYSSISSGRYVFYDENKQYIVGATSNKGTQTSPSNAKYLRCAGKGLLKESFIISEGANISSFTPYSPESNRYSMGAKTHGKNLLNPGVRLKNKGLLSDGTPNDNTGYSVFREISVKPNTRYTINTNEITYYCESNDGINWDTRKNFNKTFTTTKNIIRITGKNTDIEKGLQLEEGAQATSYEPYKESASEIILQDQLHRIGDVKDRLYFDNGYKLEKKFKIIDDFSKIPMYIYRQGEFKNTTCFYITLENKKVGYNNIISNKFNNTNGSKAFDKDTAQNGEFTGHPKINNVYFDIGNTPNTTVEEARQFLKENKVKFIYESETPTTIDIQIKEQIKLETYQPTYFTVDSGVAPSKTIIDVPVLEQVTGKSGALRTPATLDRVYLDIQGIGEIKDMMLFEGVENRVDYINTIQSVGTKSIDVVSINTAPNIMKDSAKLRVGPNEYLGIAITDIAKRYMGCPVTISADVKVPVSGTLRVYTLGKYSISNMSHHELKANEWTRVINRGGTFNYQGDGSNGEVCNLSFYGTYETGRIPEVKNIKISIGRHDEKEMEWVPHISELPVSGEYFDKKTITLKEPLRSLPSGVKDTIEKINGEWKIIRRCGQRTFTPEDSWVYSPGFSKLGSQCGYIEPRFPRGSDEYDGCISTHFITGAPGTMERKGGIWLNGDKSFWVGIPNHMLETPDKNGYLKWLRENRLTIVYQLKEPVIETISPLTLQAWKNGSLLMEDPINVASTHTVALNKPGQILKNIEELTILRDRVEKLEANYDQLALEQAHQLALTKQSIELDYEI